MKFRRHKPELTVRRNGQYSAPLQTAENQVINSILFIISSNYNMSRLDTDNSTVSDTTNPTKATERQEGATRGEEKQEGPTGEHRDDTEEAKEQPERKIENQRLNEPNNGKDRRRHEKPPKQHGRQRTQEQERTTDEEEQGPQEHAHTSVPDGREKILRDPEKLPSTPQEGDFNRDVVLQDLRRGFKKNNYDEPRLRACARARAKFSTSRVSPLLFNIPSCYIDYFPLCIILPSQPQPHIRGIREGIGNPFPV